MTSTPIRIDPRIRERLIEVRRQAGLRRLRLLIVAMSILCAVGLAYLVVTSPLVDVDAVHVSGARRVSADAVRTASRVNDGDALLFVDTGVVARRIEQLPWVRHATVRREYPGTLNIVVSEFTPTVYVRVANSVMLVAANGRVVARANKPESGSIEVRGVRRAPGVGELLAPAAAANIVPQLPAVLAPQVAAVDVGGEGIALVLRRGGAIRLGTAESLAAKGAAAVAVLEHLGDAPFTYIDVSTPLRPVSHV